MFITRKRFEKEMAKAHDEGYSKAVEQRYTDDRFRDIQEQINRLADMIDKPKTISGFGCEVKPNA